MKYILIAVIAALLSGCVHHQQLTEPQSAKLQHLEDVDTTFVIPSGIAEEAWMRADGWVSQHSAYRIQRSSSAALVTYSPSAYDGAASGKFGYRVTRQPVEQGHRYTVECVSVVHQSALCDVNSRVLSHYIQTGEDVGAVK